MNVSRRGFGLPRDGGGPFEGRPSGPTMPTVGLNIGRVQVQKCRLTFWDLGGQASLRGIWEKYYSDAHALLFVVDASDAERLDDARAALHSVLQHHDMAGVPVLLFANKQDVEGALAPREVAARLGLPALLNSSQPRQVVGTAGVTGTGGEGWLRWRAAARPPPGPRSTARRPTPCSRAGWWTWCRTRREQRLPLPLTAEGTQHDP